MTDPDQDMPRRALIVDDDAALRDSLQELLEVDGWDVTVRADGHSALTIAEQQSFDVLLTDLRMPGMTGMQLLEAMADTSVPVVLISAHGDIPVAVEAMRKGAYSFVEKPFEPRRLLTIMAHAAEQHRLRRTGERLRSRLIELTNLDRVFVGQSPEMETLRSSIADLAATAAPVLILGETGTGKELAARALHDLSANADRPFMALNCAALPEAGFEESVFGREDGPEGMLAAVAGGTLFLDEISACPEPVQAKLLRVLETGNYYRLGSAAPSQARFRLVSASNEEPEIALQQGRLRADFLFRINTLLLAIPPLRQRISDVPSLFAHFADQYAQLYELKTPAPLPEDTAALLAHDWPGNVRELRHVAERFVLASRRDIPSAATAIALNDTMPDLPATLREAVAAFERTLIARAIRANEGRMDEAAESLGIGRRTLNDKIVKLGLDKQAVLSESEDETQD